jgi:hypothetical protein
MNQKMDKVTENSEEDISLDNYPFIKIGCIIGITYGSILLISYIVLIHILKIYSLKPIFYIAIYIGAIFELLYFIYAFSVIFDMTVRTSKKLKNEDESENKGKN